MRQQGSLGNCSTGDLFEMMEPAEAGYGLHWRKTSRDCSARTMVLHLQGASESYSTAGLMKRDGAYATVNISEWPNDGAACSLSVILEENPATRYLLSPRACAGILRRAAKRGKELPPMLEAALRRVANMKERQSSKAATSTTARRRARPPPR